MRDRALKAAFFFTCAVALLAPLAARAAGPDMPEPHLIIRSVQRLHAQMAQGSATAQAAQAKLVQEVSEGFLHARPEVWKKPRNVGAAAILLLSGGPSAPIRKLMRDNVFAEDHQEVLLAALAYAEGRQSEATRRLEELDLAALPAPLAGQFALAAATLLARSDPARADALFSRARLLMPGTLVEETALRRQAFLADDRGDLERFAFYAGQYLHRFAKSVYASTMHERFPVAVQRFALSDDAGVRDKLDSLMDALEPEQRRSILIDIARAALVKGRLPVAALSAARARDLSREGSILARRAEIYLAAANVLGPERDRSLQALSTIPRSGLTPQDEELAAAARAVGAHISRWPAAAPPDNLAAEPPLTEQMRRAEETEASIDVLLNRKRP